MGNYDSQIVVKEDRKEKGDMERKYEKTRWREGGVDTQTTRDLST